MVNLSLLASGLVGAAFLSAAIGLALAYLTWRRRETRAARPFLWFVLAQSAWSTTTGLLWLSPSFRVALSFNVLTHVLAVGSLVAWVVFVVDYTHQRDRFRGWPRRLFLGWAGLYFVLRVTNPVTELLIADLQPASFEGLSLIQSTPTGLFVANLLVIYGVILWTYWLLVRFARTAIGGQGRQALIILGADIAFVGINFTYYAGGYSLHPSLDPSPIFFTVTVVVIAVALFAYDFLDFEPLVSDLLLEEMDDPIVVRDDHGGLYPLNDPASTLIPADAETLTAASPVLADAVDTGGGQITLEHDGGERTFDVSVSPIRTQTGQKRGDLIVIRDITLQKQREQELEQQNERLDAFASVVSHDLRNPLHVANGQVTLAREECDSVHLEKAEDALARMETLIDDVLTLAREGETVSDPEPVDLAALVERCWETVTTDDARVRIETELTILADRSRLRQVLENMFRNAVEHGGAGVTVTVGELPEGGGFYIADDGPGIPEQERDRLFESGYSTAEEGTGFGLAIVAEIVDAHGWEIGVADSGDGGTRFEITGVELVAE